MSTGPVSHTGSSGCESPELAAEPSAESAIRRHRSVYPGIMRRKEDPVTADGCLEDVPRLQVKLLYDRLGMDT